MGVSSSCVRGGFQSGGCDSVLLRGGLAAFIFVLLLCVPAALIFIFPGGLRFLSPPVDFVFISPGGFHFYSPRRFLFLFPPSGFYLYFPRRLSILISPADFYFISPAAFIFIFAGDLHFPLATFALPPRRLPLFPGDFRFPPGVSLYFPADFFFFFVVF